MNLRLMAFSIVVSLLWLGFHIYMDRRLVSGSAPGRTRWLARALVVALALLPVTVMVLSRAGIQGDSVRPVYLLGFLAMGASGIALSLLLTVDVLGLLSRLLLWRTAGSAVDNPALPGRRGFLGRVANFGVVGTAGGVTSIGYFEVQHVPKVREVDVPIAGLNPKLDGFSIAQMTDIHVGPTIRAAYLRRCVEVVNGLGADVVAITGDLIDGYVEQLASEVASLSELRAPHGVYFVTGNHEYYWDGPAWCDHVAGLGLEVLNNRHRILDLDGARILLAGCTDHSAGSMAAEHACDPVGARAGAPPCDISILLAHQPRSVFEAAKAGYDLQISGHTHGGQYFPMNLLVHLAQPYVAGLVRHENTWLYVSRGTGYWGPPMRFGAPAEITLLRLRRQDSPT